MKIALIGTGKMGTLFERAARARGLEIAERFSDVRPLKADSETKDRLKHVSVMVDFSVPDAVMGNIRCACDLGINLVEGTTGWNHLLREAEACVLGAGIGMVYASNFSLGVNLFYQIVEHAARLIAPFSEYDAYIEEVHHKHKKDAPSGTALVLKEIVEGITGTGSVPVASLRAGHFPGRHSVGFDSPVDTIRLSHTARNREGLAEGALLAVSWIEGKKGFHHFRNILNPLTQRSG